MTKLKAKFSEPKYLIAAGLVVITIVIAVLIFTGLDIFGAHGHSHD